MGTRRWLAVASVLGLGLAALFWRARTGEPATASAPGSQRTAATPDLEPAAQASGVSAPSARADVAASDTPALAPSASTATLRVGIVARSTGAPVEGAQVLLLSTGAGTGPALPAGFPGGARTADAAGRIEFRDLPTGVAFDLQATARAEPFGRATLAVDALAAGETRELVVELPDQPDRPFWLRVVRADDASPIAGARVFHSRRDGYHSAGSGWMTGVDERELLSTDPEGYLEVQGSSWRREALHVGAPGFSPAAAPIVAGHTTRETAFVVRLALAAKLVVRVVDPTGVGLEGLAVVVTADAQQVSQQELWTDYAEDAGLERSTSTASDGRARFEGLPAGAQLGLIVREAGEVRARRDPALVLDPGAEREVEIVLGSGTSVLGRAVDQEGAPVAELEVWLAAHDTMHGGRFAPYTIPHARARTDADGRFAFAGVSAGLWNIGPRFVDRSELPDATLVAPQARVVSIAPTDVRVEVELVVGRGLYLQGRVELPDGSPAVGCSVRVQPQARGGYVWTTSGADGSFCLGPLAPGPHTLEAGGVFTPYAAAPPLTVAAGTAHLVVTVARGARLVARFVAQGESVDAEVFLDRAASQRALSGVLGSHSSNGEVTCEGLEAGAYSLYARGRNGRVALVRIELAEGETRELSVELEPGARLRFENRSADFVYVAPRVDGLPLQPNGTSASGVLEYDAPPGALVVRVMDAQTNELALLVATLAAGETHSLVYPAR